MHVRAHTQTYRLPPPSLWAEEKGALRGGGEERRGAGQGRLERRFPDDRQLFSLTWGSALINTPPLHPHRLTKAVKELNSGGAVKIFPGKWEGPVSRGQDLCGTLIQRTAGPRKG